MLVYQRVHAFPWSNTVCRKFPPVRTVLFPFFISIFDEDFLAARHVWWHGRVQQKRDCCRSTGCCLNGISSPCSCSGSGKSMDFPVENHAPWTLLSVLGLISWRKCWRNRDVGGNLGQNRGPKTDGVPSDTSEIVSMQHLYFNMSGSTQKMVSKFNSLVTKMEG